VRIELVPVTLTEAKTLVNRAHEHNEAPLSWKFGTGIAVDGELVGVAMVGRPTGRGLDQQRAVEITRVCITEKGAYRNAASMLYGAACRMAAAGGYLVAWTYTMEGEDAASVRAAGFALDAELEPRELDDWGSSRPRYTETLFGSRQRPTCRKFRWRRDLVASRERVA
jgi:hypothetical protein